MIMRWLERWGGVDLDELIEQIEEPEVVEDEPEADEPVAEPDPDNEEE